MNTKKSSELEKIASQIENCDICKENKIGKPVPGEGGSNAKIMFVGEAPGRQESQTGRPFIGRSGKYLTRLIESTGLSRKDVYITSPVKYFPVKPDGHSGRAPTDQEITHGKTHFDKQVEIVNPKLIVLLGKVAAYALLGKSVTDSVNLKTEHGKIISQNGRRYLFTYHPAAALRFPQIKQPVEEDFKKLKRIIKE